MLCVMMFSQRVAAASAADRYFEEIAPTKTRSMSKEGVPVVVALDDPGAAGHAAVAIRPDVPIIRFVGGSRLKKIRLCEGPGYGNILTLVRGGKAPCGPRSDRRLVPDSDLVGAGLAGREVICESDGKVISADAQGGAARAGV